MVLVVRSRVPRSGMLRRLHLSLLLLLSSLHGGCAWMYPTAVPMRTEAHPASPVGRAPILLVLLPGRGDTAADWAAHGFVDDIRAGGAPVDVIAADAHFGYYARETIVDRVWTDIVEPARRQGYQHIWLAGISMGGIGAIINARAHGDAYERLILLAPYAGPKDLLQQIDSAGGPAAWTPTDPNDPYQKLWIWLKQYADPRLAARLPEITLGFGSHDKLERGLRVLARLVPAPRIHEVDGKHDWVTWRKIWQPLWAPAGEATLAARAAAAAPP